MSHREYANCGVWKFLDNHRVGVGGGAFVWLSSMNLMRELGHLPNCTVFKNRFSEVM